MSKIAAIVLIILGIVGGSFAVFHFERIRQHEREMLILNQQLDREKMTYNLKVLEHQRQQGR